MSDFRREWAMPSKATFSIRPISDFVERWLTQCEVIVDPFARNSDRGTCTNDLNPHTRAEYHMKADDFLHLLSSQGLVADAALLDMPYSPRQVSDCYKVADLPVNQATTQNGALYKKVRNLVDEIIRPHGIVLSFGWNSVGMGISRGYRLQEVLLVCHGGAHNDTICIAETKG